MSSRLFSEVAGWETLHPVLRQLRAMELMVTHAKWRQHQQTVYARAKKLQPSRSRHVDYRWPDCMASVGCRRGYKGGNSVLTLGSGGVSVFALQIRKGDGCDSHSDFQVR